MDLTFPKEKTELRTILLNGIVINNISNYFIDEKAKETFVYEVVEKITEKKEIEDLILNNSVIDLMSSDEEEIVNMIVDLANCMTDKLVPFLATELPTFIIVKGKNYDTNTLTINYDIEKRLNKIIKVIFFEKKNGTISTFFQKNSGSFIPEFDKYLISKDVNKTLVFNFMYQRFDKITDLVNGLTRYVDIDEIPDKYLHSLATLIGYTPSFEAISKDKDYNRIRNLISNMREVYRYKGSIYSIELFFNSIGIPATIKELYFDRRLQGKNHITEISNESSFYFYLTDKNPCSTVYPYTNEIVSSEQMVETKSIVDFEMDRDNFKENYPYFKTNFVFADFSLATNLEYAGYIESDLKKFINGLLPVFAKIVPMMLITRSVVDEIKTNDDDSINNITSIDDSLDRYPVILYCLNYYNEEDEGKDIAHEGSRVSFNLGEQSIVVLGPCLKDEIVSDKLVGKQTLPMFDESIEIDGEHNYNNFYFYDEMTINREVNRVDNEENNDFYFEIKNGNLGRVSITATSGVSNIDFYYVEDGIQKSIFN